MRVLFIDPPRAYVKNVRTSRVKEPDIGLGYLSAYLKNNGNETGVIDGFAEDLSYDDIEDRLRNFKPDVLGMPLFTFKAFEAAEIARRAKKLNPRIKVVVGGAHATALPRRTLLEFNDFDFAVMGEGEVTTLELIRKLEADGAGLESVKGIAWRRDGEVVRNSNRESIRDLDSLPYPDWGAYKLDVYFPLYSTRREFLELPVSSARGCHGRCSFCFRLTRGYIRRRSPKNVVGEIERDINSFGAGSIIFMDEAFTAEPERTHELCAEMVKAGLPKRIYWLCETRVDKVDLALLRHMKEAGCGHVSFGVESGSQEILDKNCKRTTVEQAYMAVKWAKEAGLPVDAYYILGLPYETPKTLRETRRFALRAKSDFANFFIMVPYPGTMAMKLAREGKANLKLLSENWSQYGIQIGGAVELKDISRNQLERFQLITYLMFYLRPGKWKSLVQIVSFKAMPIYLYHVISGIFFKKNVCKTGSSASEASRAGGAESAGERLATGTL